MPPPMLKCAANSPDNCANNSLRDRPASSTRDFVEIVQSRSFWTGSGHSIVEEQAWISDPSYRRITPIIREIQPASKPGHRKTDGTAPVFPNFLPRNRRIGESIRILLKRKWVVLSVAWPRSFAVVAIASLKMTPVYEAGGTIEINKPDASLNFQNSATFSLDYYDPTELETELKILQSDLLAMQVIRELNLDRRPEFAGQAPPTPIFLGSYARSAAERSAPRFGYGWQASREILRVALSPNTRIIEVHYRSPDPQMAANVVNTLMQTYVENNFKARFESTMQASDWLHKQLSTCR